MEHPTEHIRRVSTRNCLWLLGLCAVLPVGGCLAPHAWHERGTSHDDGTVIIASSPQGMLAADGLGAAVLAESGETTHWASATSGAPFEIGTSTPARLMQGTSAMSESTDAH